MANELDDERTRIRGLIGKYGIWRGRPGISDEFAVEAERLGFGSLWLGGSPLADLGPVETLLAATERIVVATGIVNIWTADAIELADSFHRIEAAYPGRFILGIGVGHPEREARALKPYSALVEYLDVLEDRGVPATRLALAALGDRILALSGERTLGAHPYFVPPAHSRHAREVLGPSPLLIPEQRVTIETDPDTAHAVLRPGMAGYFELKNYRENLLRLGYPDETLSVDNDEVVDLLAVWGTTDRLRAGLDAHLEAGADHVLAQLVTAEGGDLLGDLGKLAAALGIG